MAVKWVQNIYDAIKNAKTPGWLKYLLKYIVEPVLKSVGTMAYEEIRRAVIVAAGDANLDNQQKFDYVINRVKEMFPDIKDNALRMATETVVAELKQKGHI